MDSLLEKIVAHDLLRPSAHDGGYAREWAAYKQALQRVEDVTNISSRQGITPLSELDEAAVALVLTAWHEGARVGAVFARVEDELDYPLDVCDHCNGSGRLRRGPNSGESCGGCGGKGFVTAGGEWVQG